MSRYDLKVLGIFIGYKNKVVPVRHADSHSFLTTAIDGGEWSESVPAALYCRGKVLRNPL
jgi:hypothetical protein